MTIGASHKRILKILVFFFQIGKTIFGASVPFLLAVDIGIAILGMGSIIINNYGNAVCVALARIPHIGTSILKHGNKEGNDITLGIHVFNRLHQAATLPFPTVECGLKIPAMTLPQGNHILVKAFAIMTVGVLRGDEGTMLAAI